MDEQVNPAEESFEKRMEELYLPKPSAKMKYYIDRFFEPQTQEEFDDMIDFILQPDPSYITQMEESSED